MLALQAWGAEFGFAQKLGVEVCTYDPSMGAQVGSTQKLSVEVCTDDPSMGGGAHVGSTQNPGVHLQP